MRGLEKNKQSFWYALYERSEPILDEYGNEIGTNPVYTNPVKETGNVSAAKGRTDASLFGVTSVYDKTINPLPPDCPITETSILWIDRPPVIEEDGTTKTGHDYVVAQIAHSLNHKAYAVSKVDASVSLGGDHTG